MPPPHGCASHLDLRAGQPTPDPSLSGRGDITTLLLIGGSGFFGKSFLDAHRRGLLAPWRIDRIIVVARGAASLAVEHPELVGPEVELLAVDIGTAADLPPADYVVHAASSADARAYADDPQAERANILRAIDNYCAIARRRHRGARIVYASSGAVYGAQPAALALIPEGFTPAPASGLADYKRDYAEAKRLAEARMATLGEAGLRVGVARCFAFVGAYLPRDRHFAIGNFLADGLAGRPVRVAATRPVWRSYMHADDLVRWLMTIAEHAAPSCPVYNVGSDEAVLIGELAAMVADAFGVAADVPALRSADTDRYVPATSKARDELGLDLRFSLRAAIADVAARLLMGPSLARADGRG